MIPPPPAFRQAMRRYRYSPGCGFSRMRKSQPGMRTPSRCSGVMPRENRPAYGSSVIRRARPLPLLSAVKKDDSSSNSTRTGSTQVAPFATQSLSNATCSAFSGDLGGICRSGLVNFTASTSRLLAGSPATTAGPWSPPAWAAASESRRSPPSCFSAP